MSRCGWTVFAMLFFVASTMADETTDIEAMLAADRAFDTATAQDGVEGWLSFFDEQGSMHLSSGETIVGHDAIRELMTPVFADSDFSLRWQPESAAVLLPGGLGYTIGHYESRARDEEGELVTTGGSYVSIWKRQADGSWKVVFDAGEDEP